ncbi:hypothetical protein J4444_04690 [Candidatus Woesearchaeota archaeon]|nr:hypothetical protein [Candidatus Woesearchaeota archaeon]
MATFLDIGLIQSFSVIFPVLIVFALVFAILSKTKAVGDSPGINAIIAVAAAFLVLLSKTAVQLINFMVPWFTIALVFFILLILIFQVMGAKEVDLHKALTADSTISWAIIGIAIVIMVAGFASIAGQTLTDAAFTSGTGTTTTIGASGVATTNFNQNVYATLFNPKVLGMIVLFGIAIFAVALLTGSAK